MNRATGPRASASLRAIVRPSSADSSGVVRISVTEGLCTYRLRLSNFGGTVSRAPKVTMSRAPRETNRGRPVRAATRAPRGPGGDPAAGEPVAQLGGGDVEDAGDEAGVDQPLHRHAA